MDTAAEKYYDDLTHLAASICDSPISLISLVDEKRQWFKSKVGLSVSETPKEYAFCAHAIQQNDIMIVEDALEDSRFKNNPLVLGDPKIRFYAGAPLMVKDGVSLGTLCVIDRKPRSLSDNQKESLSTLSQAIVAQLKYKKAYEQLDKLDHILEYCEKCRKIELYETFGSEWETLHNHLISSVPVPKGKCSMCET